MKKLTILTLLYCILPTYFFIFFWVKSNYALISLIALTFAFFISVYKIRNLNCLYDEPGFSLPLTVFSSVMISLLVCNFSEFGIFDYQSYDYQAHNYKFNLLATGKLPLYDPQRNIYMCYYLGYYLIPALLGKITSVSLIKIFAFIWTWLGLTIAFCWIQIRLKNLNQFQRIAVCFLLILGAYVSILLPILNKVFPVSGVFSDNSININGLFILNQLPIFSKSLSEATQHTLPAIIGVAFFLVAIQDLKLFPAFSLFIFSTLFWTPFTGIGLSLFYFYYVATGIYKEKTKFIIQFLSFGTLLIFAFLPVLLFLLGSAATHMQSNRMIWQSGSSYWILYYLLYLFVFFGVWFIFFRNKLFEFDKHILLLSFASNAILGLVQMGHFNDLNTRSSIVSQIILGISLAYLMVVYFRKIFKDLFYTFGIIFWFLNLLSFAKFYYERLFIMDGTGKTTIENPKVDGYEDNYYSFLEHGYDNGKEVVLQYSLKEESIFKRYLLKSTDH